MDKTLKKYEMLMAAMGEKPEDKPSEIIADLKNCPLSRDKCMGDSCAWYFDSDCVMWSISNSILSIGTHISRLVELNARTIAQGKVSKK